MHSSFSIQTYNPEQTQEVGKEIGVQAKTGDIYLLTGPLGSGKTCLTQGIASGLGVTGYVRSPTFVLMTKHIGRLELWHLDLYRIGDPWEAWDLGIEEPLFGVGVSVVEWADRAETLFPPGCCWIGLEYGEGQDYRKICFSWDSDRVSALHESLAGRLSP
jgi:tRNA threonylcarbamoyladenosine biosynthesis protein TsaE